MKEGFPSEQQMMRWSNRDGEMAVAYQAFGVISFKRKVKALAALELPWRLWINLALRWHGYLRISSKALPPTNQSPF